MKRERAAVGSDGDKLFHKTGKAKAIRFSTLAAICRELDCQPGDLLTYSNGGESDGGEM